MDLLKDLNKTMKDLERASESIMNEVLKPEVMEHLNDEQKKFVREGKQAFKLNGMTPDEKLETLTKTLKNVSSIYK